MKIQAAIYGFGIIAAYCAAGCGCDQVPVTAQAPAKRSPATQTASQQMVVSQQPLEVPTFPRPRDEPPQYSLEGPGTPVAMEMSTETVAPMGADVAPLQKIPPPGGVVQAEEAGKSPVLKGPFRGQRVDGRAWSRTTGAGRQERTTKAGRTASSDIIGPS